MAFKCNQTIIIMTEVEIQGHDKLQGQVSIMKNKSNPPLGSKGNPRGNGYLFKEEGDPRFRLCMVINGIRKRTLLKNNDGNYVTEKREAEKLQPSVADKIREKLLINTDEKIPISKIKDEYLESLPTYVKEFGYIVTFPFQDALSVADFPVSRRMRYSRVL